MARMIRFSGISAITTSVVAAIFNVAAFAAGIPAALTPPAQQGNTGLIEVVKGFFRDWLPVMGYIIIAVVLLAVGWFLLAKYSEANSKKATWGEFILTGVIGAVLALIVALFVSMATGIF